MFAAWVEKRTVHEFECEVLTSDSILKDKRPEQSKQKVKREERWAKGRFGSSFKFPPCHFQMIFYNGEFDPGSG